MFKKLFAVALVLSTVVGAGFTQSASASAYYCGKQCDGKSSHWVIPSNGVQCYKSGKVVSHGTFTTSRYDYLSGVDPDMHATVYYSTVCQTMWATVTNAGTNFKSCSLEIYSRDGAMYRPACPTAGHSVRTVMVNDHSPTNGIYATFSAYESISTPTHYYKTMTSYYDFSY